MRLCVDLQSDKNSPNSLATKESGYLFLTHLLYNIFPTGPSLGVITE